MAEKLSDGIENARDVSIDVKNRQQRSPDRESQQWSRHRQGGQVRMQNRHFVSHRRYDIADAIGKNEDRKLTVCIADKADFACPIGVSRMQIEAQPRLAQ